MYRIEDDCRAENEMSSSFLRVCAFSFNLNYGLKDKTRFCSYIPDKNEALMLIERMIIKRLMKLEMTTVKRCKLERGCKEDSCSRNPKRRKTNGCYTIDDDEEMSSVTNHNSEGLRTPGLKSSSGRVHVLPSRFNDSVIDSYKKRKLNFTV